MAELKSVDDLHTEPTTEIIGVTLRAFLIGTVVSVIVNLLPAYSAYIVHSSRMVFAHLPMATMVVFTALAWPLNVLAGRINPRWALSQGEMVVVFSMAWIAGAVPAANFMGLFIVLIQWLLLRSMTWLCQRNYHRVFLRTVDR